MPEKFIGAKSEKLELKGLSFVGHVYFSDGQKHALYLIARHLKRTIQEQYALLTGNHEPIWVPGYISAPWLKPSKTR